MAILFGTVLPWLLVVFGTWLAYQHLQQNGRILLRLEAIEDSLKRPGGGAAVQSGGLPPGTRAVDFELQRAEGRGRYLLVQEP